MSSNLKVNSLVPATGTEIGIGTTGGSIDFRCPATFGGNVTIGGTLTYDEVINIDSIGVITARSNIDCNGSLDVDGHTDLDNVNIAGVTTFSDEVNIIQGKKLNFGNINGTNGHIYYDGSTTRFQTNQGLLIGAPVVSLKSANLGEPMLEAIHDGAVKLFYDYSTYNTAKLQTTATGVTIDGTAVAGALDISGDIDVDGHTNLDNVSIAGVTTMGQATIFTTGGTTLLLKDSDSTNPADRSGIAFVDQNSTQTAFIGKESASDAVLTINNTNTINPIRLKVNNTTRLEVGNTGVYATGSLSATGTLSAGGILYIPDDIQHTGDVDTKIRFPANDTISFETAGSERLRIQSNGLIGIGTATVRNSRAVQITGASSSVLLITGNVPSVCLNVDPDDSSDNDRSYLGQCAGSNNFANGTAAGDTILRGSSSGKLHFASGTNIRMFMESDGDFTINTGTLYIPQWISHVGDTDSKFGFLQPDIIQFDTAGTTRLKIMNTGQIRIDQATSANNGIRMRPSGWSYDFRIGAVSSSGGSIWLGQNYEPTGGTRDSASYGTNYLRFTTGGEIYFGTGATDTNPDVRLKITNTGNLIAKGVRGTTVHHVSTADVEIGGRHIWNRIESSNHATTSSTQQFKIKFFRTSSSNAITSYYRGVVVNVTAGGRYDWGGHGYVTHSSSTILMFSSTTGGSYRHIHNVGYNHINNNANGDNHKISGISYSYDSNYLYATFSYTTNLSGTGFKPYYNIEVIDPSQCTYDVEGI